MARKEWNHTTIVVFRKERRKDGQVFALMPENPATDRYCTAYAHIGQHSAADYAGCIANTRPATKAEYASLKRELEAAPYKYKLVVRQRYTARRKGAEA